MAELIITYFIRTSFALYTPVNLSSFGRLTVVGGHMGDASFRVEVVLFGVNPPSRFTLHIQM